MEFWLPNEITNSLMNSLNNINLFEKLETTRANIKWLVMVSTISSIAGWWYLSYTHKNVNTLSDQMSIQGHQIITQLESLEKKLNKKIAKLEKIIENYNRTQMLNVKKSNKKCHLRHLKLIETLKSEVKPKTQEPINVVKDDDPEEHDSSYENIPMNVYKNNRLYWF